MKKFVALSMFCASILPVAAYAENPAEGHSESHAENYVGVSVSKLTAGTKSTGAGVMFGHRFNENLAAEVAYDDSGALSSTSEKTTAFSIAAIGIVPFNANFEGYGRLGYASAHTKDATGISANHGDITYGVGVECRLNEKFSVGFGWNRVRVGDDVGIPRANENSYALTLVHNF